MELKRMMEKLGQAKTHLELKKMIAEVDKNNSGVSVWGTYTSSHKRNWKVYSSIHSNSYVRDLWKHCMYI